MSDDLNPDETPESEPQDPNFREALRNAEREAKAARAQLEQLQRERAFDKAGIPETGPGALLRKAYDGEISPDAIRATAQEYGIFEPVAAPAEQNLDGELESLRRGLGATSGSGVGGGPNDGEKFLAGINSATSQDEVMAVVRQFEGKLPAGFDNFQGFVAGNTH